LTPTLPAAPSDAELVSRGVAGDRKALETLIRRHYRAAFAVALAYARHRENAEDICHDALLRASIHLAECRTPDRFLPWVCTIVRNHARNVMSRGFSRHVTESLNDVTAASEDSASRAVETKDLRRRLETALSSLSPVQREVVLLHDMHGCAHEEIAGIIGSSAGMSRQHLFKARQRMRRLLGEGIFEEYANE
jgi:RNA polymerase sigma-70 factor (ECF subfamily)